MGFGDNDHTIRGLMGFIEITSREFTIENVYETEEPPITKGDGIKLKKRFILFYILNLSIRKVIL